MQVDDASLHKGTAAVPEGVPGSCTADSEDLIVFLRMRHCKKESKLIEMHWSSGLTKVRKESLVLVLTPGVGHVGTTSYATNQFTERSAFEASVCLAKAVDCTSIPETRASA